MGSERSLESHLREIIVRIEDKLINVGPSGCTGYEERASYNEGIIKAVDEIYSYLIEQDNL